MGEDMRVADVIGTVTLSRCHPCFTGAGLRLVVPLTMANLLEEEEPTPEVLVAWDDIGSGLGSRVAISEGAEAAQPFRPEIKAVDAYVAAILDRLEI